MYRIENLGFLDSNRREFVDVEKTAIINPETKKLRTNLKGLIE
jgi:hypothetical protein